MRHGRLSSRRPQYRDVAVSMSVTHTSTVERDRLFGAPAQMEDEFGIYIHIPFCAHICPYCDFNTYAGQSSRIPAYVEAVRRGWRSGQISDGRSASSVFIGGGTPSLLAPIQIRAILDACESVFELSPGAEVTIEANPNNLDERYCSALLEAGVNRLSIGTDADRRGCESAGLHGRPRRGAVAAARRAGFTECQP